MPCGHSIPPGYHFCGVCGAPAEGRRCRCGFVAHTGDAFCGQCGANLYAELQGEGAKTQADLRYDLNDMLASLDFNAASVSSSSVHVSQDDIEQLFKLQTQDPSS